MTANEAAILLWANWRHSTRIDALPAECRPATREAGYRIQAEVARLSGQPVVGWKIAATSVVGQQHINVAGPLAARLLGGRRKREDEPVPLAGNAMNVAEGEFAFLMRDALPVRKAAYTIDEVMLAVESLHPAIEIPDSRYHAFTMVGASQLIADMACAGWFVVGRAADPGWRTIDLSQHAVTAYRNLSMAAEGSGARVLGDPRIALTWVANELCAFDDGLRAGDLVITGTCLPPVAVAPGDRVRMDFGSLGSVEAIFRE